MSFLLDEMERLKAQRPLVQRPTDFEEFWLTQLQQDFKQDFNHQVVSLVLEPVPYVLPQVEVSKVSLVAGDGVRIKGHYIRPNLKRRSQEGVASLPLYPGLVRFHGYSGNRGQISELLLWALQGYAVLGLDVRGQCGETPDGRVYPSGSFSGWMTLGLESPKHHYLRQVYLDAVRAVEALSRQPEVDSERIGVFGKSQGGGLAVISAALINGLGPRVGLQAKVKVVSAAIPFLADFRRAFQMSGESQGPMAELMWYFRLFDPEHKQEERVFNVLDYFDAVNFAPWVGGHEEENIKGIGKAHSEISNKADVQNREQTDENQSQEDRDGALGKSLVSMGLKDTSCPPETVYALYQALSGEKDLRIYPDYGHESPDEFVDRQIEFFANSLLI